MKALIAVHHFPPKHTSGAELRAYRTARWLQNHGHEVYVTCVEKIDRGDGAGLTYEDDIYEGLPVRRLSFTLDAAPDPFHWEYDNPWIGEHLQEHLLELAPDILHLISGYLMSGRTLRTAYDLGIPTVVTLTDFWFLCPRINLLRSNGRLCGPPFDAVTCARCLGEEKRRFRIPGQFAPRVVKLFWQTRRKRVARVQARMDFLLEALKRADAIISPSRFLREVFVRAGVSGRRITFSRQGRDFPDLTPEVLEKTPADRLRIGYLGQIAPHKGVHVLFEAIGRLPGAALEVKAYGDATRFPEYAHRLRQMARRDPRLSLPGVYHRSGLTRVLQSLDIVAVPSLWYENSPNTILEAFAHQTPVIVSDLGGMAELVEKGKNGLRFTAGDERSLADGLRRLLNNPRLLSRLRAGITPIKSVAEEMGELEEIYRVAMAKSEESRDHT